MKEFFNAFKSRRVAISLPLGFAAGLPFAMRGSTLNAWITDVGLDIKTIGMFTWVGLFFTFKPLWAPIIDRFSLPFLGRRRGWMLVCQVALALVIAAMGSIDPTTAIFALAVTAAAATFLTATHDIASDAYRADMLPPKERGSGSALYTTGYRVATILATGIILILVDHGLSWRGAYLLMGALMVVGVVATVLGPEPEVIAPPRTITAAVVEPLREFFSRPATLAALAFIMLYKFGDYVGSDFATTFLMKTGYSKTEIGSVQKSMGMIATIVGAILGGGFVPVLGLKRALLIFGVLQALMNVGYVAIAYLGVNHALLVSAIVADQFCGGLGTAAFAAFQLSLCSKSYSATQYALLSSASTALGRTLGGFGGFAIAEVGWANFYILTMVLAIPGLVLAFFAPIDRAAASTTAPPPAAGGPGAAGPSGPPGKPPGT